MPLVDAVESPRPTVLVELDAGRTVTEIATFHDLAPLAAALQQGPCIACIDAPLGVANTTGRRPIDELLAWLDVPVFPVSRRRANQVWGGLRGEELRSLVHEPMTELYEAIPDAALRLIQWENSHSPRDISLEDFRKRWLSLRPPRFRPKGSGRATPRGTGEAFAAVGHAIDWAGWHPTADDSDWQAIADAGVVDAALAADTAWRLRHGEATVVEWPGSRCVLGNIPILAQRIRVNVDRLAGEGLPIRLRTSTVRAQ